MIKFVFETENNELEVIFCYNFIYYILFLSIYPSVSLPINCDIRDHNKVNEVVAYIQQQKQIICWLFILVIIVMKPETCKNCILMMYIRVVWWVHEFINDFGFWKTMLIYNESLFLIWHSYISKTFQYSKHLFLPFLVLVKVDYKW